MPVTPEQDVGLGWDHFTPCEEKILPLLAAGLSVKEVAKQIGRTAKTVDSHRGHFYQKLGIHRRVELTLYAIKKGLI